jgi:hypothetical protein
MPLHRLTPLLCLALLSCGPRYKLVLPDKANPTAGISSTAFHNQWSPDGFEHVLSNAKSEGIVSDYAVGPGWARATLVGSEYSELEWHMYWQGPTHDEPSPGWTLGMMLRKLREPKVLAKPRKIDAFLVNVQWPEVPPRPLSSNLSGGAVVLDEQGRITHYVEDGREKSITLEKLIAGQLDENAACLQVPEHTVRDWLSTEVRAGRATKGLEQLKRRGFLPPGYPLTARLEELAAAGSGVVDAVNKGIKQLTASGVSPNQRARDRRDLSLAWGKLEPLLDDKDREAFKSRVTQARSDSEKLEGSERAQRLQKVKEGLVPELDPKLPTAEAFAAPLTAARAEGRTATAAVLLGMQHRLTGGAAPEATLGETGKVPPSLEEARKLAAEQALKVVPAPQCGALDHPDACSKIQGFDSGTALRDLLGLRLSPAWSRGTPLKVEVSWTEQPTPHETRGREKLRVEIVGMVPNQAYETAVNQDPEVRKAQYTINRTKLGSTPDSTSVDTSNGLAVMEHNIAARGHNADLNALNEAEATVRERRLEIAKKIPPLKLGRTGDADRVLVVRKQTWEGDFVRTVSLGEERTTQSNSTFARLWNAWDAQPDQNVAAHDSHMTLPELRKLVARKFDEALTPWIAQTWRAEIARRIDKHVEAQTGWSAEAKAVEKRALRHLFLESDPEWSVTPASAPEL